jgi:hypothetical protein
MSSRPPRHPSPGFLVRVLSRLTDRAPQTASIFWRLTSAFVSPVIARASAQPVLDAADLPPLAEADHNAGLVRTAYPVLVSCGRPRAWDVRLTVRASA